MQNIQWKRKQKLYSLKIALIFHYKVKVQQLEDS